MPVRTRASINTIVAAETETFRFLRLGTEWTTIENETQPPAPRRFVIPHT
jgi:hypothetical protein